MPEQHSSQFRFYEELNDFLPPAQRKRSFDYSFAGTPAVKDTIEAIGVPHTEVDLILVDRESVGFGHRLTGGERVAVYPMFERLDISPINRLRPAPLREPRFVLDVHLGRLARYLRLLGFDVLYRNDYDDHEIVAIACRERRIALTRDKGLLKHAALERGYWLRETRPRAQVEEVVDALDLRRKAVPFTRCLDCNGRLRLIAKADIQTRLPPQVRREQDSFARCESCGKLYWPGTHFARLRRLVDDCL